MLQRIRDGIQGWTAWLIIILLIAAMSFWGISAYFSRHPNKTEDVVARINDQTITRQRLENAYRQFIRVQSFDSLNEAMEESFKESLLNQMVDQVLLSEIAKKNSFSIGQEQINLSLSKIPIFFENGQFSNERLTSILNQMGYTPEQFFALLIQEQLSKQIHAGLTQTVFVLPNEIDHYSRLARQTRSFSYANIPFAHFASKIDPSQAEIKNYYDNHSEAYKRPERIQVDYILLSAEALEKTISPSETELKQFYNDNLNLYTTPGAWHIASILVTEGQDQMIHAKLNSIQKALKSGQTFESIARKFSDDPLSAKHGGQLAWTSLNAFPPSIQEALKKLKVGEISAPIKTDSGYQLVKLTGFKKPKVELFETIEAKLKKAYVKEQAEKIFNEQTQRLQDLSLQNSDSLYSAATALHATIQTSGWLVNSGMPIPNEPFAKPPVINAAFSETVRNGNNSEVIYPDPRTAIVLRLKAYETAKPLPLAQVYAPIKQVLIQEKSRSEANAIADQIVNALNRGKSLKEIQKKYGFITWKSVNKLARNDTQQKINSAIIQAAFNVPRPLMSDQLSATSVPISGNIAVIAVSSVNTIQKALLPSEQHIYKTQIENYYTQIIPEELKRYYRNRFGVKVYKPSLRSATELN